MGSPYIRYVVKPGNDQGSSEFVRSQKVGSNGNNVGDSGQSRLPFERILSMSINEIPDTLPWESGDFVWVRNYNTTCLAKLIELQNTSRGWRWLMWKEPTKIHDCQQPSLVPAEHVLRLHKKGNPKRVNKDEPPKRWPK